MRHSDFIYGVNPHSILTMGQEKYPSPLSVRQLGKLGIPARKVPRIQEELGRLAQTEGLQDEKVLMQLALRLAEELL